VAALAASPSTIMLVSNEVGCGIVPENALARRFRDEAGRLNQAIAAAADTVFLVAAGLTLKMK
jgi:adenosylcobinamide kinase/adenosylcobinamide-phosphate guanylyltransferase